MTELPPSHLPDHTMLPEPPDDPAPEYFPPSGSVHERLAWVCARVGAVGKNMKNVEAGYGARSIDDVLDMAHPLLAQAGILVPFRVLKAKYREVEIGYKRTLTRECTMRVRFMFTGPNGDTMEVDAQGEALDSGDKATNKAVVAAFKYALLVVFTIPVKELASQADADLHTYERSTRFEAPPVWDATLAAMLNARWQALPERLRDAVALRFEQWLDRPIKDVTETPPAQSARVISTIEKAEAAAKDQTPAELSEATPEAAPEADPEPEASSEAEVEPTESEDVPPVVDPGPPKPSRPEDCATVEQIIELFSAKSVLESAQRVGVEAGGGKLAMAHRILGLEVPA